MNKRTLPGLLRVNAYYGLIILFLFLFFNPFAYGFESKSVLCLFPFSKGNIHVQWESNRKVHKGVLLVADPKLSNSYFGESVILIAQHNPKGSMGVIINRPTKFALSPLLPDIQGLQGRSDILYQGGPVLPQSIVMLFRTQDLLPFSEHVFDAIQFSTDLKTMVEFLDRDRSKEEFRAYSGYSGWGPGQLLGELERGDWRVVQAFSDDVFNENPHLIWETMIRRSSQFLIKGEMRSFSFPSGCI